MVQLLKNRPHPAARMLAAIGPQEPIQLSHDAAAGLCLLAHTAKNNPTSRLTEDFQYCIAYRPSSLMTRVCNVHRQYVETPKH